MKPEKTPQQKLESEIASALQKLVNGPLSEEQLVRAGNLAHDVVHFTDGQSIGTIDKDLQSLLNATGLKASDIAPITALVASLHPKDSSAHKMVVDVIGNFKEEHKVELAEAAKPQDFLEAVIKDLGGSSRLDDFQMQKVAELTSSLKNIGDPDGQTRLTTAIKEFAEIAPDHVTKIIGRIEEYHKNDPAQQALVSPVLAPIKGNELFGSITKDLEKASGRQLDDFQMQKVAELTSSLTNIERDGPERFSKALDEFVKIAPERAVFFIGPIQEFHKNEPAKQALVLPALEPLKESVKANGLNRQLTGEMQKLVNGPLSQDQLLAVAELSQSVAHISSKDDITTLTRCLDAVVKDLTPEQAKPIIDLVEKYHKDNPTKQDLVSSGLENITLKKEPEIEVAVDSLGSVSVDEITQAIRDEVITKQQTYLQGEIAKTMTPENGILFNQKTPEEVRVFLATPEGKDMVKLIMSTKEAQLAMNKIEVEGYKKVHEAHKDSFKNVGWAQETGTKVRIAEITNEAGEKVASLKETTVDATPTRVTLEDGTTRDIKSYRQIDFPLELKDGKGPAHFSMAVKDENGRNISAKDAVYFTAHYDDNGKLMEVSSPVPVKFMGDGDDAIGYIERNGKVYTLPVTQGKYKEMMQEVAINNGLGVDVGQSVDSVSVPPRTVGQELQEPEMLKKSGPVAIDPNALQQVGPNVLESEMLKKSGPVAIDPNALQTAKIADLKPIPKIAPDQPKPLTDSQKFEQELQAKKASLTKTDLGAQVYGYEQTAKSGPDQVKPLSAAEELQKKERGPKED